MRQTKKQKHSYIYHAGGMVAKPVFETGFSMKTGYRFQTGLKP